MEIDSEFLPFSREQLEPRFEFSDRRTGDPIAHFEQSAERYQALQEQPSTDPRVIRRARQIERDETFWTAACLMRFFEHPERRKLIGRLLDMGVEGGAHVASFDTWEEALGEPLELYFEVGLSSPASYRERLRDELEERNLIRYVIERGSGRSNLEGRTQLDAMLLAPSTGFAVHFEAKVTSDIDSKVTYDLTRNQIARNVDAMLEPPGSRVSEPLSQRDPARSIFVLLTPRMFQERRQARLYGWLMDEYRREPSALRRDLPHRSEAECRPAARRLGRLTWEDCNDVLHGSCRWLESFTGSA